jgi:hypothetical protein
MNCLATISQSLRDKGLGLDHGPPPSSLPSGSPGRVQNVIRAPPSFFQYLRSQSRISIFRQRDGFQHAVSAKVIVVAHDKTAISNHEHRKTASRAVGVSEIFLQRHPPFSAVMHYCRCFIGNRRCSAASKCCRTERYVNAGSNADAVSNRGGSITDSDGIAIANSTRRRCDSGAHGGANPDPNRQVKPSENVTWEIQANGRYRLEAGSEHKTGVLSTSEGKIRLNVEFTGVVEMPYKIDESTLTTTAPDGTAIDWRLVKSEAKPHKVVHRHHPTPPHHYVVRDWFHKVKKFFGFSE